MSTDPHAAPPAVGAGRSGISRLARSACHAALMGLMATVCVSGRFSWSALEAPPADQIADYQAQRAKTIVELQQFRHSAAIPAQSPAGGAGTATLIALNPKVNAWFLLLLQWSDRAEPLAYHLENPDPRGQSIALDPADPHGIQLSSAGRTTPCELWYGSPKTPLEQAGQSLLPYAPLCDGRLYLRNPVGGKYTSLERVTNFLRDHVWGGEKIIGFVRREFFRDVFIEKEAAPSVPAPSAQAPALADAPTAAAINAAVQARSVVAEHLGIELAGAPPAMALGRWYPARDLPGVFVGLVEPRAVAPQILESFRGLASPLDMVEANALDLFVAFDLAKFDVGFALGADHPRVGWSERALDEVRGSNLPGPDGIGSAAPLVTNGMVSPALVGRTAATFTGGFKRQHGAFRYGALARQNYGSHYGFIEQGTVFSKLRAGLATLYVLDDGSVDMKTWTEQDDSLLARVKHARQNGVALVERDPASGAARPGSLVSQWGAGNWSGSADEKLRTLRAGVCLQETSSTRFLIYGYFSAATPSAMARVFQAYGCRYAMHLDMNALEHTYLALYVRKGSSIIVEHLIEGMAQLDKASGGRVVPRFLGYPDNRDFFYLVQRKAPP